MIAMFQHQNAVTRLPAIVPMAKRHLQRHFHAGRTAVGKENAGEARGRNGDKATRHVFGRFMRSEEHTSELQSLMRISYAVFCLKKKNATQFNPTLPTHPLSPGTIIQQHIPTVTNHYTP